MTADADKTSWTEVNKYDLNFGERFWDTCIKTKNIQKGLQAKEVLNSRKAKKRIIRRSLN